MPLYLGFTKLLIVQRNVCIILFFSKWSAGVLYKHFDGDVVFVQ